MNRQATLTVLVLLVLAALAIVGCTDEADTGRSPQARTLTATQVTFTPAAVRVRAGQPVMLTLKNHDLVDHDFVLVGLPATDIDDDSRAGHDHGSHDHGAVAAGTIVGHAAPHEQARVWFTPVQRGRYEFFCSLPGHRESGMRGVLTVE